MMRRGYCLRSALALALALILPPAALALGDTKARQCSIAIDGSATNITETCYFGLTDEQLRQLATVAVGVSPTSFISINDVIANICSAVVREKLREYQDRL